MNESNLQGCSEWLLGVAYWLNSKSPSLKSAYVSIQAAIRVYTYGSNKLVCKLGVGID